MKLIGDMEAANTAYEYYALVEYHIRYDLIIWEEHQRPISIKL